MSAIPIVTTAHVAGHRIVRSLGLVRGNTIRVRHVGSDIMASLRNFIGGEIPEYTKMMAGAREQALDRMHAHATMLDADAVVEVRFTTSMVMAGAAEILVYGTAVKLERDDS